MRDSFILDERVLKLGMIWQWKANKGSSLRRGHGHLRRRADRRRWGTTARRRSSLAASRSRPMPAYAYPWPVPTMSQHQAFRRVAVPPQVAQKLETITFPAPTRGIILSENEAYMQPGAAIVCDNWKPTMRASRCAAAAPMVRSCRRPRRSSPRSNMSAASIHQMFAANATKVYDVTTATPVDGQGRADISGNYVASQMANAGGDC